MTLEKVRTWKLAEAIWGLQAFLDKRETGIRCLVARERLPSKGGQDSLQGAGGGGGMLFPRLRKLVVPGPEKVGAPSMSQSQVRVVMD